MALSKFKESLKDLKTVVKVVPNDKDAKKKMEECDKIVKKIAFEKAIDSEKEHKVVSDSVDPNNYGSNKEEEKICKHFFSFLCHLKNNTAFHPPQLLNHPMMDQRWQMMVKSHSSLSKVQLK